MQFTFLSRSSFFSAGQIRRLLLLVLLSGGMVGPAELHAELSPELRTARQELLKSRNSFADAFQQDPENTGAKRLRYKLDDVLKALRAVDEGRLGASGAEKVIDKALEEARRYDTDAARTTVTRLARLKRLVLNTYGDTPLTSEDEQILSELENQAEQRPGRAAESNANNGDDQEVTDQADSRESEANGGVSSTQRQDTGWSMGWLVGLFLLFLAAVTAVGYISTQAQLKRIRQLEQRLERLQTDAAASPEGTGAELRQVVEQRMRSLEETMTAYMEIVENRLRALEKRPPLNPQQAPGAPQASSQTNPAPRNQPPASPPAHAKPTPPATGQAPPQAPNPKAQKPQAESQQPRNQAPSPPVQQTPAQQAPAQQAPAQQAQSQEASAPEDPAPDIKPKQTAAPAPPHSPAPSAASGPSPSASRQDWNALLDQVNDWLGASQAPLLQKAGNQLLPGLTAAAATGKSDESLLDMLARFTQTAWSTAQQEGAQHRWEGWVQTLPVAGLAPLADTTGRPAPQIQYGPSLWLSDYKQRSRYHLEQYPPRTWVLQQAERYADAPEGSVLAVLAPPILQPAAGMGQVFRPGLFVVQG